MTEAATKLRQFETRSQASQQLATDIAEKLQAGIDQRGRASLVVSGGSSPLPTLNALADLDLNWGRVSVTLSDERWVALGDPLSNEAMVRRELLRGPAAGAELVGLFVPDRSAAEAVDTAHQRISAMARPFDAVLLGMGADGHTASLFPGSPELDLALSSQRMCEAVAVPQIDQKRMTLTPAALLDTEFLALLFFGEDKLDVYQQALQPGDVQQFPVRSMLHQDRVPPMTYYAP